MIAAEYDGQLARAHYVLHFNGQCFTRGADLRQVFRFLLRRRGSLRAVKAHVAEVAHFIAELRDALIEARDAHRRRPEIDARECRAETERHADDAHTSPATRLSRGQRSTRDRKS